MPQSVQLFVSDDGINFRLAVEKKVEAGNESGPQKFQFDFPCITARFIKLKAVNHGIISNGNPGAGFPAWLFVDEVVVE
jgi:hexosaminidase